MTFLKDIALPLVIAGLAIGVLNYIILLILRFIRLDMSLFKIALFFIAWYFVGPILYNLLLNSIIVNENEIISFIYTPVQTIMAMLSI